MLKADGCSASSILCSTAGFFTPSEYLDKGLMAIGGVIFLGVGASILGSKFLSDYSKYKRRNEIMDGYNNPVWLKDQLLSWELLEQEARFFGITLKPNWDNGGPFDDESKNEVHNNLYKTIYNNSVCSQRMVGPLEAHLKSLGDFYGARYSMKED